MPRVEFHPSGSNVIVPHGTLLIDAARLAGIEIESPCGGKGTCGRCIVLVSRGAVDFQSQGLLSREAVAEGYVLACKARVIDDVAVSGGHIVSAENGRFVEEDETYLIHHELLPREWQFDPLAVKWLVRVPPPQPMDGLSDLDRLTRAIQVEWGPHEVHCTLRVLQTVAGALRAADGLVTVTLVRDGDRLHCVRVEPGDQTTRHFAVAVDVGTTTVAVQLINLALGRILGTRSGYNDQITCGQDVISRINYAMRPDGLAELHTRVLGTINRLLDDLAKAHNIYPDEITNAVISANTTMTHLALGLCPEYIRIDPYTPTVFEVPYLTAEETGIDINPDSWICFSPNIGSYVGGDITAGLLCTDIARNTDDVCLFIDIGTNGELVIGNRDFLMSCACSAGPAFEGGGIEYGMRAAAGAIDRVEVDAGTGQATYATIGGMPAKGICGSGMIELIARLYAKGWIDPAGKLNRSGRSPSIQVEGRNARYLLVPGEASASGKPITISELDIENIIRAKAAIYSASALLLAELGLGFDDLAQVYIAGGFGRFLDLEMAIVLGLIPDIPRERFRYIGNASLMGSYMVAVSQEYRQLQVELARRITYIDLSAHAGYMDEYMAAMFIPHTDATLFPSVVRERVE